MAITRDFKQTVVERVERDPQFAKALLDCIFWSIVNTHYGRT